MKTGQKYKVIWPLSQEGRNWREEVLSPVRLKRKIKGFGSARNEKFVQILGQGKLEKTLFVPEKIYFVKKNHQTQSIA